mmetsp:Transcript_45020/g.105019  ORF Transcript_45020/g.105019 Transcript_45020/m.105019 type:complete len:271 (-) Transcript_45020:377-1189(-)
MHKRWPWPRMVMCSSRPMACARGCFAQPSIQRLSAKSCEEVGAVGLRRHCWTVLTVCWKRAKGDGFSRQQITISGESLLKSSTSVKVWISRWRSALPKTSLVITLASSTKGCTWCNALKKPLTAVSDARLLKLLMNEKALTKPPESSSSCFPSTSTASSNAEATSSFGMVARATCKASGVPARLILSAVGSTSRKACEYPRIKQSPCEMVCGCSGLKSCPFSSTRTELPSSEASTSTVTSLPCVHLTAHISGVIPTPTRTMSQLPSQLPM